jgi:hypothetical protein
MLEQLRRETGFGLLVAHEETGTGVTYARDRRVRCWAREVGVDFLELPQTGVVRRLSSRNGWNRLWEQRMDALRADVPRSTGRGGLAVITRLPTAGLLGCRDLGLPADTKDRQRGGEQAAHAGDLHPPLGARTRRCAAGLRAHALDDARRRAAGGRMRDRPRLSRAARRSRDCGPRSEAPAG